MKKQLLYLTLGVLAAGMVSCSTVTNAIDSFFTFNYENSFDLPFPKLAPIGENDTSTLPIAIDSATLASKGTSIKLIRSAILTKLQFTFSDPTYIMKKSVDTIIVNVTNPTMPTLTLATYSKSLDTMQYSNAEFATYIRDSNTKFLVTWRLLADPKTDITAHCDFVITLSAKPL